MLLDGGRGAKDGSIWRLGPGDFFGEIALVEHGRARDDLGQCTDTARDFDLMSTSRSHDTDRERPCTLARHAGIAEAIRRWSANAARGRTTTSRSPHSSASTPLTSSTRWIQARISHEIAERAGEPGLRIGGPEHQAFQPCQHDGSRAHRAWLERDVECRVQPPDPRLPRGLTDREDLRVRAGVLPELALVVTRGDHLAAEHHDGADRHVVGIDAASSPSRGSAHHRGLEGAVVAGVRAILVTVEVLETVVVDAEVVRELVHDCLGDDALQLGLVRPRLPGRSDPRTA